MGTVIPLADVSRSTARFPFVTACLILTNVVVFAAELMHGDAFVLRWSATPSEITSGHHWITILTAMFLHGSWSHILGNMVFLWAFGPEVEDAMNPLRYSIFYLVGASWRWPLRLQPTPVRRFQIWALAEPSQP